MKRLILAVAIASSTAPTLANVNAPFEQSELDRVLPQLWENASAGATGGRAAPWVDHSFIAPAQ